MSHHRACCKCQPSTCPVNWGSCTDPVLVSVTGLNSQHEWIYCDSGSYHCTAGYPNRLRYDVSCDLTDLVFNRESYVDPSLGSTYRWVMEDYTTNTGEILFGFIGGGDPFQYDANGDGSCGDSFTPNAVASLDFAFNDLPGPDYPQIRLFTGTITVEQVDGVCRFRLSIRIRILAFEAYTFDYLQGSVGSPFQTVSQGTSETSCTVEVQVNATAPYDADKCPHEVSWTMESASVQFNDYYYFAHPESPYLASCPAGTAYDCAGPTPSACYLGIVEPPQSYMFGALTPALLEDAGKFHFVTQDTPTIGVTV